MTRVWINAVFYIPYVMLTTGIHTGFDDLVGIMILVWGFFGFRWLMDAFMSLTRVAIFASFEGWGMTYLVGSILCSIGGFVIIPVQVVAQILQLRKLNEALKPSGASPLASAAGTPA